MRLSRRCRRIRTDGGAVAAHAVRAVGCGARRVLERVRPGAVAAVPQHGAVARAHVRALRAARRAPAHTTKLTL